MQMFADVNPYLFCNSEEATSVMVELLRTYTDENASEVKDDAKNCIVSLLGRPNVLIMDFLLTLPPVAALQGEPIYQVQSCYAFHSQELNGILLTICHTILMMLLGKIWYWIN